MTFYPWGLFFSPFFLRIIKYMRFEYMVFFLLDI
uniref:Uncharacterized protein n=1 Tax=Anguilla anguilla TaxID=7936 RepID=A0A0E9W0D0_ANGAN